MGYPLIWIESLASALLVIALLTTCSVRSSRPFLSRVGTIGVAALLSLVAALLTWALGWFQFEAGLAINWFWPALAWTLAFATGALALMLHGFRQRGDDGLAARSWSRAKLVLTLAALVLLTWTTFSNMDLAVKIQMATLRADAGAMILAGAPPRVLDRDNAALIYQEAFANLTPLAKAPFRTADLWLDVSEYKYDPNDKELPAFLASQERALALFRQAAAMPGCWFEHDYFKGVEMLLPEIDQLRQGAYLLALDAHERAAHGDSRGTLDDVSAMVGIAQHINDPILISFLVSAAIEKAAGKVLENVLPVIKPNTEDLGLFKLDATVSYRRAFHRACQMEEPGLGLSLYTAVFAPSSAGVSLDWLRDARGHPDPIMESFGMALLQSPFYRVFFLQDDLAGYRKAMQRIQNLAERPYYETAKDWEAFDLSLRTHIPGVFAKRIIPGADRCAIAAAKADAAHQLSRLAIAMTGYRVKYGRYPAKLDDLVPEFLANIPGDPFDGQPLRMKRADKEVLLYSVGRDLKDDGGVAWNAEKQTGDIVFRLTRE
jgi:hypothetical protein